MAKKGKKLWTKHQKKNQNIARKRLTQVSTTTKFMTKKGKLKGRNKKETKILKAACPHHFYTKNGELTAPIYNGSDGTRVCELCGAVFSAHFYGKEEVNEIVTPMVELSDQMKFMATAIGVDNADLDFITKGHIYLKKVPKLYRRLKKVAAVKSRYGKKKKNKKNYTNMQYGSWK